MAQPVTLALPSRLGKPAPPTLVTLSPAALSSILDSHLRRPEDLDRVFGALLGSRRETDGQGLAVDVKAIVGLPYAYLPESGEPKFDFEELEGDGKLLNLVARSSGGKHGDSVLGWFSTSPELNSYTPLLHDRYAQKTGAHTAVHLTIDPSTFALAAYVSSSLSATPKPHAAIFLPIRTDLRIAEDGDRAALDTLLAASGDGSTSAQPTAPPLDRLKTLLRELMASLDETLAKLEGPDADQIDDATLKTLHDTLASMPVPDDPASRESFEDEFERHLSDILLLSYLSNLAGIQVELASRLALVPERRAQIERS